MKITQDVGDYAKGLNDLLSSGTLTQSGVIADGLPDEALAKAGMAGMSEKFRQMGEQYM
jgi:phosphomethylpyrimidine synthase